jgi:cell wall-associated NlpC family hydrolase
MEFPRSLPARLHLGNDVGRKSRSSMSGEMRASCRHVRSSARWSHWPLPPARRWASPRHRRPEPDARRCAPPVAERSSPARRPRPASRNDDHRKGFDCSGLVRYAYYRVTGADILNGTAHAQFHTTRAVARFARGQGTGPLLPGDLMFYGAGHIHHVAIYLSAGQMVEACRARAGPEFGCTAADGAAAINPAGRSRP